MEEEEEKVILKHFSHQHPLTLVKSRQRKRCYGCRKYFSGEELAYGCSHTEECGYRELLHEECAEMPRQIRHPMHPLHILRQEEIQEYHAGKCALCRWYISYTLAYCCGICKIKMHLGCAAASMDVTEAADDEHQRIKHPSHPEHELRLLVRPGRSSSFKCDGCGTIEKGRSYVCSSNCHLMIHEDCASLPITKSMESLHNHPLSLAFHIPIEYIRFEFDCDICEKALLPKYWVYHCEICWYVVHIKCAIKTSPATASDLVKDAVDDDESIIKFPINDVSKELIKPFVMREGVVILGEDKLIINGKYRFHNHHHQLSLISSEEADFDDDDDDDDCPHHKPRSELICDGCITPIYQKQQNSSSSSPDKYFYYMSCGECKYSLHLACFHLPPELSSHPLHHRDPNHKLILQTCPKLETSSCNFCHLYTNGLFYGCASAECDFKIDIKCASLPDTVIHAADPKHRFNLNLDTMDSGNFEPVLCHACGDYMYANDILYSCDGGEFNFHCKCVLLPATIKHRWDEHLLPLTYDAGVNHPTAFYCAICEEEMNPRRWMYHCSDCDESFHPDCFRTICGEHRNIKFGQQYIIDTCHPHPLTYQLITTRQSCYLCDEVVQGYRGFQCASCNFVMCFDTCGEKNKAAIKEKN